ncbi:hypothetical protein LINPERPRIM_LOCUS13430 [Linum perenne]
MHNTNSTYILDRCCLSIWFERNKKKGEFRCASLSSEIQTVVIRTLIKLSAIIHHNSVHQPGIKTGSVPWQGTILPLDHWCCMLFVLY